jgi:hypothetical protein
MTKELSGPFLGEFTKGQAAGEAEAAKGETLHDAAEQARLAAEAAARAEAVAGYIRRHGGAKV